MNQQRYETYKDSGIPWLGEIPAHWECHLLKRLVSLKSGDTINYERIDDNGSFPVYGGNGLRGYTHTFTHDGYYVLIGRQGALCGNINYVKGSFFASEHAIVASPKRALTTTWLGELLRNMNLNQYSISAAQPGLSVDNIERLSIAVPPLSEQRAIAAYLDERTAKLDQLIANKREQVKQLETLRKVTIHNAVTKGLNPDAPMKGSGIPWLGEIPAHWEATFIKRKYSVQLGKMLQPSAKRVSDTQEKYLRAANIQWSGVDDSDIKTMWFSAHEKEQYALQQGDLLISEGGDVGRASTWDGRDSNVYIQNAINRVRGINTSSSRFLFYWIFTIKHSGLIDVLCNKSTIPHYTAEKVERTNVPFPPLSEQRTIATYLNKRTAKLDQLIANKREQIKQIETLRKVTIHDAVTGNINVSGLGI